MGPDGSLLVVLKVPNYILKTQQSLSRHHDTATKDNPQTSLWTVSCWKYFLSAKNKPVHSTDMQDEEVTLDVTAQDVNIIILFSGSVTSASFHP